MNQVDVTVIVAPRSLDAPLRMALAHLEHQTFPSGRFEVLVVDAIPDAHLAKTIESFAAGSPVRVRALEAQGVPPPAAFNRAVEAAQGRWLLFLDETLLAGPECVAEHVCAQERNGALCAILGPIRLHSQADDSAFVKRSWWYPALAPSAAVPVSFLDWRLFNLSLPRRAVLDAGGFDEEYGASGMWDIDLAWRLSQRGVTGLFMPTATAFAWKPVSLEQECRRHYADGCGLRRLQHKTASPELTARYGPVLSSWRKLSDAWQAPVARRLCPLLASDTRLFDVMCRGLFRHALRQGYRAASFGSGR